MKKIILKDAIRSSRKNELSSPILELCIYIKHFCKTWLRRKSQLYSRFLFLCLKTYHGLFDAKAILVEDSISGLSEEL